MYIVCEVNLEYAKFVTSDKGKKVLYVLILKVIYGMIENALLRYDLFSTTLLGLGLKLNPYEQCILIKVIDEHQCKIGWFVGDNKVPNMDDSVNSMISEKIEEKIGNLSCTTGKKHTLIVMDIEFIGGKKVTNS